MIAFIDDHRDAHGRSAGNALPARRVEPICKVLPIAPSTYRAHAARRRDPAKASARARRAVFGAPAAYPAADGVYIAFEEQEPELMFWTGGGLTALKSVPASRRQ